jgi:hypothetical protein
MTSEADTQTTRPKRYETTWRGKYDAVPNGAWDIPEMVRKLRASADELEAMGRAGVTLAPEYNPDGSRGKSGQDDYYVLGTDNAAVAERFGLPEGPDREDTDDEPEDPDTHQSGDRA